MLFTTINSLVNYQPYEVGTIIIPVLQLGKLRHRILKNLPEVIWLVV